MKKRYWIPALILLVLAVAYFLGPPPPEPVFPASLPEVPAEAAGLEKFIAEKESAWPLRDDNHARIVWADSSRQPTEYAFVYLHGFAGSYRDGYPFNVKLAERYGANLYLARYAGHGLRPPASLEAFSPESAWEDAKEALAIGEQLGEKVILLSTSTGGTLATLLAAQFPGRVHALINIGPNFQDDIPGTWMLNTNWGYELAHLVSMGDYREVSHEEPTANQYWDTMFVADALLELQVLVDAATQDSLLQKVQSPVLTMYYHEDDRNEDERVEVSIYPEIHQRFSTPPDRVALVPLPTPRTHFCGSDLKSADVDITIRTASEFCEQTLGMTARTAPLMPPG